MRMPFIHQASLNCFIVLTMIVGTVKTIKLTYVWTTLVQQTTQLALTMQHSRMMRQHFLLQVRSHLVTLMKMKYKVIIFCLLIQQWLACFCYIL